MNGKMKFRIALLAAIFVAALVFGTGQILANNSNKNDNKGDYIVVFNEGVDPEAAAQEMADLYGIKLKKAYKFALKGMSVNIPEHKLEDLRNDPRVAYVEEDFVVTVTAQTAPTGLNRISAANNANVTINGVDDLRIDVDVAVVDTGIDLQHTDLNVVSGVNCMSGVCVAGGDDDQYHGTHVAGTIGALDNNFGVVGVAPGARLWAVKVLDSTGNGTISTVIAGLDYVAANAAQIEVANLSLGCACPSTALDTALNNAVAAGVTVVVAAGNDALDAAAYTPANNAAAITVSALADFNGTAGGGGTATCRSDVDDTLADFSNYGTVVDITAPGACIYSTYPIEKGSYATLSGTSMAAPHVSGAAALLAASGDFTPEQIKQQLLSTGSTNWVDTAPDGVQEPLLDVSNASVYHPATVGGAPSVNGAPVVTIKSPAANATFSATALVNFWGSASDPEQGYLSSGIVWTSSLQGQFGTGSSFNKTLNQGTHLITATVTDAQGATGSASITITFGSGATSTPAPTSTALPTSTPLPTNTPQPTTTGVPTNTPLPTNTAVPSNTPAPTNTAAPVTDTGYRGAASNSSEAGGDGDGYATNPNNAYADDGVYAVDTNSGTSTNTSCTHSSKDMHRFYDYNFAVPAGAVIKGIQVRLDAKADNTSGSPKLCVQLSWDGGLTWTAAKTTSTLSTAEQTYQLGGATDTWGRTWNAANLSNASFRVRVIGIAGSTSRDFSLDWVAVKVFFTP